jgi:regulator of cell morphogenesis and NO signaling
MKMTAKSTVGEIATEYPLATRVFSRYGIDFCCGGGRNLEEICEQRGLDCFKILEEIHAEFSEKTQIRWDLASVEDLIEHILTEYHRPLDEEFPRLEKMAQKVLQVHGDKDPEVLSELLSVYQGLKSELQEHFLKEEQILFPMILRGKGEFVAGPISVMLMEHESAGLALKKIRELTCNYRVPEKACTTWKALWVGLKALEESLHEHIHLENNILFPRVLTH